MIPYKTGGYGINELVGVLAEKDAQVTRLKELVSEILVEQNVRGLDMSSDLIERIEKELAA